MGKNDMGLIIDVPAGPRIEVVVGRVSGLLTCQETSCLWTSVDVDGKMLIK